jgi:hypothetical protein
MSTPPWWLAVPVRPSEFVPLTPDLAEFNVQVDLGAIAPFGDTVQARDHGETLYCDLQLNPDVNYPRRLGSGRSGYFRRHYLKGIGRTVLAGNWADPGDQYHGTGHLAATGAAREAMVSAYLEGAGLGDTIVGCRGVLARPLPASLRGYPESILCRTMGADARGSEVDRHVAALSVKAGDFARLSNIHWLLERVGYAGMGTHVRDVMLGLAMFTAADKAPLDPSSISPTAVVDGLATAFDHTVDNFRRFFEAGVMWISIHNNVALDGRFVDLELPVVIGAPLVGDLVLGEGHLPNTVGFEVFDFMRYAGTFLRVFRARLELLAQSLCASAPRMRDFLRETTEALVQRFDTDHWALNHAARGAVVSEWFRRSLGLRGDGLARLQAHAAAAIGARPRPDVRRRALPLHFAEVESGVHATLYAWDGVPVPSLRAFEPAQRYCAALRRIDAATSVEEYLAELGRGRAVAQACGRVAMRERSDGGTSRAVG